MKAIFKLIIIALVFGLNVDTVSAQDQSRKALQLTREGNKLYLDSAYKEAEERYQMANIEQVNYFNAKYNLANTLFKQKRYKEAKSAYEEIVGANGNPIIESFIQYNLGNCALMEKDLDAGIENYKSALRLNPKDQDARYNLSYAMEMKKQQEQQQQQDKQDDKDNKDENKDKKDDQQQGDKKDESKKEQDEQKQSEENGDKNKGENKEENKSEGGEKDKKLNQKESERLLKAMAEKEKETKEKLDKKKIKVSTNTIEKDW